jgi:translation initiation factor 1
LRRETAHRGGKCVTIVDGFDPDFDSETLHILAKRLRLACGCGGAVKGRAIELQGDQPTRVRELLVAEGFRVVGER